MNVVMCAADGENLDLCIACHRAEKLPYVFGLANERQASFRAEDAMDEIDVVCVGHGGRRYAAPDEMGW